jgi:hypothetical protein
MLTRVTLVAAIAASSIAIGDAVTIAATGHNLVDEESPRLVSSLVNAVHATTYALIVAVLVRTGDAIDHGSRLRRWSRRLLAAALAVLTVTFATSTIIGRFTSVMETFAGASFLLMFVLGAFLGVLLLRGPARVAASLMFAPLVLLPAMIALNLVAPRLVHPGYAEAALYIGLALLGGGPRTQPADWRRGVVRSTG